MSCNKPDPLEKEMLVRLYRRSPGAGTSDFCAANNASTAAFRSWMPPYMSFCV